MEKLKKPELIVISNDDYNTNLSNKNLSLQGGFKNFRAYINSQRKKNMDKKKKTVKTLKKCYYYAKNF